MSKLVRLYPRDPERGWLIQTYLDPQMGLKFLAARGWYKVSDDQAEELKAVRQKHYDARSQKAFLIADDSDHARELEETVLRDPEAEEENIGTIEAPVETKRPGSRKKKVKPRKRTRKPGKRSSVAVKEED
jgi:hypothetical protein